jgi:DNA-binding FadR family transcriptional regulator
MSRKIFTPVKSPRVHELIEEQIRKAIFLGKLKPEHRLPSENELSMIFRASRSTVRSALRTLESEGLIVIKQGPRGGSYVQEINATPVIRYFDDMLRFNKVTLEDLTEARLLIEPEIAKQAALKRTDYQLKSMEEILRKQKYLLKKRIRSIPTNVSFHGIIGEASQNPVLSLLNQSIMKLLQEHLNVLYTELENKEVMFNQHTQIYKAILAGNAEKACLNMKNHVETVRNVMKPPS